jgi:hypothetical protein
VVLASSSFILFVDVLHEGLRARFQEVADGNAVRMDGLNVQTTSGKVFEILVGGTSKCLGSERQG